MMLNATPPAPVEVGVTRLGLNTRIKNILAKVNGKHHFHNFAEGMSPFAKHAEFEVSAVCRGAVVMKGIENVVLVFAAHRFEPRQIEAMVGTIVCILRGLLPLDFLDVALSQSRVIPVPQAPKSAAYFVEGDFKGYENKTNTQLRPRLGMVGFDTGFTGEGPVRLACKMQARIRDTINSMHGGDVRRWLASDATLAHLDTIRAQYRQWNHAAAPPASDGTAPVSSRVPGPFATVVELLRKMDVDGVWPATGPNRQKRIQGSGTSFTLGGMPPDMKQPNANELFPDLLAACFRLEADLMPLRDPSSTVVVNKNAQFVPHTDSGAGHGQSKSMIVGLGTYSGGELVVEGDVHDIRYRCLEFDGWKQRHWTQPFAGERYSIVFFTPHGCTLPQPDRFVELRNGVRMPMLGLGTFRLKGPRVVEPVTAAIEAGYRHIDTAQLYRNEPEIAATLGCACKAAKVERSHVFVTSKLSPKCQGYDKAAAALDAAVATHGGPLDLFLIHWPGCQGKPLSDPDNAVRTSPRPPMLEVHFLYGRCSALRRLVLYCGCARSLGAAMAAATTNCGAGVGVCVAAAGLGGASPGDAAGAQRSPPR